MGGSRAFIPLEAAMLSRSWDRNSVFLSVYLSVRLSHECFVTKWKNIQPIFWHHTKGCSLQLSDTNRVWWVLSRSTRNLRLKWPTPFEKRRLRPISAYNVIMSSLESRINWQQRYNWTYYGLTADCTAEALRTEICQSRHFLKGWVTLCRIFSLGPKWRHRPPIIVGHRLLHKSKGHNIHRVWENKRANL